MSFPTNWEDKFTESFYNNPTTGLTELGVYEDADAADCFNFSCNAGVLSSQPLTSNVCKGFTVLADVANTTSVYVGGDSTVGSIKNFPLQPGASISVNLKNTNLFYAISADSVIGHPAQTLHVFLVK